MSLDIDFSNGYSFNITHNLTKMAREAGIYYALWHPEKIGIKKAKKLIPILKAGLFVLKNNPDEFREYDAKNGWGTYEQFIPFVEEILTTCIENPDAKVTTCT